jgi:hypothetical protein
MSLIVLPDWNAGGMESAGRKLLNLFAVNICALKKLFVTFGIKIIIKIKSCPSLRKIKVEEGGG